MLPESEAGPAILLEGVGKRFTAGGRTVGALDGISARVERGSVTGSDRARRRRQDDADAA